MGWPVILHSWSQLDAGVARAVCHGRGVVSASEVVERMFDLTEGSVAPCLFIVNGSPVRYGVSVGS
jgi:hypothetical protein